MLFVALVALAASDGGVEFYAAFEGVLDDAEALDAGWLEPALKVADGRTPSSDGGWLQLGPGCFLPSASCIDKGKSAAAMEAELKELRGAPHDYGFNELVKAAWVGFGLGILSALVGIGVICELVTGSVVCHR